MGNAEPCANLRLSGWAGSYIPKLADILPIFSDAVAQTYLTGKPNFSPGCEGSKEVFTNCREEMARRFSGEMVPEMVDAV
jgi:uncharacterized protein (DUF169 family)